MRAVTLTDSATGQSETVTASPEHPFSVQGQGFVPASMLAKGSLVQRQTGGAGGNTSYYALDTAMFDGYGAKLGDTDAFTGGDEPTRDATGFQGQFVNDLVNLKKIWVGLGKTR